MSDRPPDVVTVLAESSRLNHGPAKVDLLREAVRLADHVRDVNAGFEARLRLMDAALVCGSPERGELARVYRAEAAAVAARYDARDGNDYYARHLAGVDELPALARPHPLPRRGGR
jgi:hypothetical protein